jgi:hypothetical protein
MPASRRPTARLVVSPAIVGAVDTARIDAIAATRLSVSKTSVADALLRVAVQHMDEVVSVLASPGGGEPAEVGRLLVPADTPRVVDEALVEAISQTRRLVTKAELTNTLVTVGLQHMDEVAGVLTRQEETQE